ncbi:hypothetical protein KSF73_05630 [Burkholderiaceae bacterium DAT-1]|nr:hypothetical protein [Burkholderiaceae bacterium DAT-1]
MDRKSINFVFGLFAWMICACTFGENTPAIPIKPDASFDVAITDVSVDQAIQRFEAIPDLKVLRINSSGGDITAAVRLARWIQSRHLDVMVSGFCMSACANYLFPAGHTKYIQPKALLVWHGNLNDPEVDEWVATKNSQLKDAQASGNDQEVARLTQFIDKIKQQRETESRFFAEFKVDEKLSRLGYLKPGLSDAWIVPVEVMSHFGVTNVVAPDGYGTAGYLATSPFKMFVKEKLASICLNEVGEPILCK